MPKLSVLALRAGYMRNLTEVEAHISPLAQACAAKERRLELQVSEERLPTGHPPHPRLPTASPAAALRPGYPPSYHHTPAHFSTCSFGAWLIS